MRPALDQANIVNNSKINIAYDANVRAVEDDPFVKSLVHGLTFGAGKDLSPEEKKAYPAQDIIGNFTGQIGAILGTFGFGEALGMTKVAQGLGMAAKNATPVAIREAIIGSGKVLAPTAGEAIQNVATGVASSSMLGGMYEGITQSVDQGKMVGTKEQTAPNLVKIGQSILHGVITWAPYGIGGAFIPKTAPGLATGTAAVAGTAYAIAKGEGQSEPDARLSAIMMGLVHAVGHTVGFGTGEDKPANPETNKAIVETLQNTIADYTKAKNGLTEVNNIHQMVGDEFVKKTAEEILQDRQITNLEGGPIAEIVKSAENTKELVRRVADQVFLPQASSGPEGSLSQPQPIQGEAPAGGIKTPSGATDISAKTETTKVSREQLPVGTGEEKASSLEARVKQTLESAPESIKSEISNYKEMNKKEQLKAASQYVTENPEEALSVLKGEKTAPEGLLHNSIALALEHKAANANDANFILKLASLRSTRAGQEISMLTERDPNSPITNIKELQQRKIESLGENDAAQKIREKEVSKVRKSIKKPSKGDWAAFIESIKC